MEAAHCKKCVVASQSLNSGRRKTFQQNLMLSAMPELRVSAYRSPFFDANGCPGENSHSLVAMLEFLDILFFPASTQLSILYKKVLKYLDRNMIGLEDIVTLIL